MPLYLHVSGEIKRTVPGRHEDKRVAADPKWRPISGEQLAAIRAADSPEALAAVLGDVVKGK